MLRNVLLVSLVTSGFDFGDQNKVVWNVILNLAERIDKKFFALFFPLFKMLFRRLTRENYVSLLSILHRLIYGKCYAIIESLNKIELDLVPFLSFFAIFRMKKKKTGKNVCNFVIVFSFKVYRLRKCLSSQCKWTICTILLL